VSWDPSALPVSKGGLRQLHRLRSEKACCEAEGRGFDSPHLHVVFEAFPLFREGVVLWSGRQRAHLGRVIKRCRRLFLG
jgi:hypothetical protein